MSLFKKTSPTSTETDADTTARDRAAENANLEQELSSFNGRVSVAKAFPYGVQHVLAMFVANLAPIAIIAVSLAVGIGFTQVGDIFVNFPVLLQDIFVGNSVALTFLTAVILSFALPKDAAVEGPFVIEEDGHAHLK